MWLDLLENIIDEITKRLNEKRLKKKILTYKKNLDGERKEGDKI